MRRFSGLFRAVTLCLCALASALAHESPYVGRVMRRNSLIRNARERSSAGSAKCDGADVRKCPEMSDAAGARWDGARQALGGPRVARRAGSAAGARSDIPVASAGVAQSERPVRVKMCRNVPECAMHAKLTKQTHFAIGEAQPVARKEVASDYMCRFCERSRAREKIRARRGGGPCIYVGLSNSDTSDGGLPRSHRAPHGATA